MSFVCDIIVWVFLLKVKKRLKILDCVLIIFDDLNDVVLFFYKCVKLLLEGKEVENM